MFALEYSAWFDFLLPGLARLGIPIPLGGTSNHFRTGTLPALGGWDAFNVTEDADLGVRLARKGYRVIPIDSSTLEEAPPTLRDWLGQRSRWTKGYMQTALVHLRQPVKFARAVGVLPFLGFVIFVLGAVLTSLLAPIFWLLAGVLAVMGSERLLGAYGPVVAAVSYVSLIGGCGVLSLLAMIAPIKRKWLYLAPYGISVILYWWLISAAAYKALWQLHFRTHYWEKTQHGLARGVPIGARWRRRLVRLAPTIVVLACFAAQVASANPWPKESGRLELISSLTLSSQEAGLAAGSTNAISALHLEYGASAGSTLIFDSDVQQQTAVGVGRTNFDNASASLRTVLR
jgi:cellulose synthase/poly-beta-1,6-N-acetylglucosamine synthase-like glycosyltransferase